MPKISIIVPVYNVSKYLEKCLHSLVSQTFGDIEIICVNDGSTDNSKQIISKYVEKDHRVKLIDLSKNSGISVARKVGVESAQGSYILFCDGDDELVSNACETLQREIDKNSADIIQFGTNVVFCDDYPDEQKKGLNAVLIPCLMDLHGDITKACFGQHKFGHTLWNKAYSNNLCKRAFSYIANEHIIVSEDIYIFFVISYFAKSYHGIREKLYIYNYGIGVTGQNHLKYDQFKRRCGALNILPLLERFLEEQSAEKQYYGFYQTIRAQTIQGVVYQWRNSLNLSEAYQGYQLLMKELGSVVLVSEMAKQFWEEQSELLKRLIPDSLERRGGRKVQKLGVYYHRLRNGGAEKVISQLAPMWKNMGYEVVLFTDEEPTVDDYEIPDDITRVVIPTFLNAERGRYKKRAKCWETMIKRYDIDTVLYQSPNCHILLWDVCLLKGLKCNVVIHTHCMFCGAMWYSPIYASYLPLIYRLIDCTVSLSRVDQSFWRNYCPAFMIQNPLTLIPETDIAKKDNKNILWVGRLSAEKQPLLMLEVFSLVLKEIPEATLTLVGDGDSTEWMQKMKRYALELHIQNSVEFCGFQLDVSQYYKDASVFAFTSMSEAAPVVLSESKSYALPVVMFDLPNVEFARDDRGIIKVPQSDVLSMAESIIKLLKDKALREEIGNAGRESIEEVARCDIEQEWANLFNSISAGLTWTCDKDTSIMLDLLFQNVNRGLHLLTDSNTAAGVSGALCNEHSTVLRRHEEVVNRHEEVVNRHEEVVNRHEQSINHQWEVQKWHEERIQALEKRTFFIRRLVKRLIKKQ